MRTRFFALFFILLGTGSLPAAEADRVETLLRQLNDDQAVRRDEAEQELLRLAPSDPDACDAFLLLLPKPLEGMPAEVRLRLRRVRSQIEKRQANEALVASRITLSDHEIDLAEVLEQIEKQTGNRLVDYREAFGQEASPRSVSIKIEDEPFWPAIDKILDAAEMGLYPFSGDTFPGELALAVINREAGAVPRSERASYAGPFRIEAIAVVARRGLRIPDQQAASVELEFSWEPRLRPIALSQPADALKIVGDNGAPIAVRNPAASFDVEIQQGAMPRN